MLHFNVCVEIGLPGGLVGTQGAGKGLFSGVDVHVAAHVLDVSSGVAARLALVERPSLPYPRSHLRKQGKNNLGLTAALLQGSLNSTKLPENPFTLSTADYSISFYYYFYHIRCSL